MINEGDFISLAKKYGRHDILTERKSKRLLELYEEQTREERDLDIHLKKMRAWN